MREHNGGILIPVHIHHTFDGKKRIVNKMGVDLCLQPVQFNPPLLLLIFADALDQSADALHHIGHATGQLIQFGIAGDGKGLVQIALLDIPQIIPQFLNGRSDLLGKMPGHDDTAHQAQQSQYYDNTPDTAQRLQYFFQRRFLKDGKSASGIHIPRKKNRFTLCQRDHVIMGAEKLLQLVHIEIVKSDQFPAAAGNDLPLVVGDINVAAVADHIFIHIIQLPFIRIDHKEAYDILPVHDGTRG